MSPKKNTVIREVAKESPIWVPVYINIALILLLGGYTVYNYRKGPQLANS
jgi:hypothetical protein